jgi:hypothetical protein
LSDRSDVVESGVPFGSDVAAPPQILSAMIDVDVTDARAGICDAEAKTLVLCRIVEEPCSRERAQLPDKSEPLFLDHVCGFRNRTWHRLGVGAADRRRRERERCDQQKVPYTGMHTGGLDEHPPCVTVYQ